MEGGSLLINMLGWGGLFTEYPGYDRNSHGGCQSRETRRWLTGKPSGGAKLPATLESTEWLRLAEWHRSACFSATGKCQLPGEKRKNLQQKGDSGLTVTQWKIQVSVGLISSQAWYLWLPSPYIFTWSFLCTCLCPNLLLLEYQSYWIRSHPNSLIFH